MTHLHHVNTSLLFQPVTLHILCLSNNLLDMREENGALGQSPSPFSHPPTAVLTSELLDFMGPACLVAPTQGSRSPVCALC